MSKGKKLLERMRANPRNDWTIKQIITVSRTIDGMSVISPKRGSHYTVTHPSRPEILTIPAHKPIKPYYVIQFVSMIDSIIK